jgi:hypothetical protein
MFQKTPPMIHTPSPPEGTFLKAHPGLTHVKLLVRLGHHLPQWCEVTIMVIPKPNRADPSPFARPLSRDCTTRRCPNVQSVQLRPSPSYPFCPPHTQPSFPSQSVKLTNTSTISRTIIIRLGAGLARKAGAITDMRRLFGAIGRTSGLGSEVR